MHEHQLNRVVVLLTDQNTKLTLPDGKVDSAVHKAGEAVWENQCRHCHGASAYPGKAPKLKPSSYTPDFIYDRVTFGFRAMPAWKDVFSLAERKSVVAYIKSDRFNP